MTVAIAMAHGHTPKWLQVAMCSLKRTKNNVASDVYIAETWPGHPSIRAITENDLGEGVNIHQCAIRKHSHATGLDEILDLIRDKGYEYMFAMETDCMAMKDNWLDWFVSQIESVPNACMAGFFWHEGNNHKNINPSGTLYKMDMLLKYHDEVRANKENVFYHPNGNRHGNDAGMDPTIKDVAGAFSETRGVKDPNDTQRKIIIEGVPQASWFEPGAWLYYRSLADYTSVSVPCDHIYTTFGPVTSPEGTYYGGKKDPQFIHFWGGTRAYDWKKHVINDGFVCAGAPHWIAREDRIWRETVPEAYRGIVTKLNAEEDIGTLMQKNLGCVVQEAF